MTDYQDGALDERDDDDLYADDGHGGEGDDDAGHQEERQEQEDEGERRQAEDGDGDDERRRSRNDEKRQRRERQRLARERSERQIRELTETVHRLQSQLGTIDQRTTTGQLEVGIAQAQAAYQQTQQALRDAVESGDTDRQVKLMEDVAIARRRVEDLSTLRERAAQPQKPQQVDPGQVRMAAFRDAFILENQWFDPNFGDPDSRAAGAISSRLIEEGIAPDSPAHWRELKARLKQQRPHLYGAARATDERRAPRQPTGGNGRGTQQGNGPSKGWATPERRHALSEMGLSESDPQAKPYIDAWKSYDKSAAGAR